MNTAITISLVVAIACGIYVLDRVALWLEARGWIYYRTKRGSVPLGRAVMEAQALLDPSKRHMLEAPRTSPDDAAPGDPPPMT